MPYFIPLTQIFLSGSTFSTVALTVERFISVCAPFFKQRHNIKAWMFVVPVLVFVFAYGSPRFFEMEVIQGEEQICSGDGNSSSSSNGNDTRHEMEVREEEDEESVAVVRVVDEEEEDQGDNSTSCRIETFPQLIFKDLRLNPLYVSIYANWMNLIFQLLIPVVVNITLNVYIYRAMQRFRGGGNGGGGSEGGGGGGGRSFFGRRSGAGDRKVQVGGGKSAGGNSEGNGEGNGTNGGAEMGGKCGGSRQSSRLGSVTTAAALEVPAATGTSEGIRRVVGNEKELKKRDSKYTRASIVMVLAFIFCNAPRLVPNCMELLFTFAEFPEWAIVLVSVNQLLTVANSTFNFLIYLSFCRMKKKKKQPATRPEVSEQTHMAAFNDSSDQQGGGGNNRKMVSIRSDEGGGGGGSEVLHNEVRAAGGGSSSYCRGFVSTRV